MTLQRGSRTKKHLAHQSRNHGVSSSFELQAMVSNITTIKASNL